MRLASLNPQQSRRLAIATLFAAVALIAGPIAFVVWSVNQHYETELANKRDRIARLQAIASTRTEVGRQLDAMRAKDPRKFFLRGGAVALSAAEVQEAVRAIIEQNGGTLVTMQAPTSRDDGRFKQINVNLQITATVQSLKRILHAIDSNTPYLFVDNLLVRSQVAASHRPGPGQEPPVFVHFDVTGYAPGSGA